MLLYMDLILDNTYLWSIKLRKFYILDLKKLELIVMPICVRIKRPHSERGWFDLLEKRLYFFYDSFLEGRLWLFTIEEATST